MTEKAYTINDIKAVILVGGRDFKRCPVATRLSRALWPVAGRPVVQLLIEQLAAQGVRKFVLCCDSHADDVPGSLDLPADLDVRYIEQAVPRGTAGSIRDAADGEELLCVFSACTLSPPDMHAALNEHLSGQADMTVFFNPVQSMTQPSGEIRFCICGPAILEHIPKVGYCDIKEGLIPTLVIADNPPRGAFLPEPVDNFIQWRQYLTAVWRTLEKAQTESLPEGFCPAGTDGAVWAGRDVQIHPSARLCGPVLIGDNTCIQAGAAVFGPTQIGTNVRIGPNAIVENSVVWDNARLGRNSHLRRCLVDYKRRIPSGVMLCDSLVARPLGLIKQLTAPIAMQAKRLTHRPCRSRQMVETLADCLAQRRAAVLLIGLTVLLLGVLTATYWSPTILDLWRIWLRSDEYSSGLIVPFLALYILWARRKSLMDCPIRPALAGAAALLAAQGVRLFGLYFMFASAERLALVLSVGAIVLLVYGWRFFWRFAPIFLFLFLMLPLPNRAESMITMPLQQYATVSAVYSLETIGYSVIREGNIIRIGETVVAVAEACNGLRMLTAFFVISGFVVLITDRKWWEKGILLASTIPIALLCNTVRLTLTSIAFTYVHTETLEELFHDFGGLAMMPLAIGLIVFQLWLLKVLFNPPESVEHQVLLSRNTQ